MTTVSYTTLWDTTQTKGQEMARVETILFDADGVVQRPKVRWRTAFAALPALEKAELLNCFVIDFIKIEEKFLECEDDFAIAISELAAKVGSGVDMAAILNIINAIEIDKAIMDVVQSIRSSGIKCYLTTNQQAHRARHMSETLGYAELFDGEFYSCRLGVAKPKHGYFEYLLANLNRPGESMLFLDDRPENVAAAVRVGIRGEVFDVSSGPEALLALLAKHDVRPSANYRST